MGNAYRESKRLLNIAGKRIPGWTQTTSKGPLIYGIQNVAHYLKRAKGCKVWDVDGNEYIDYSMGVGSNILGYADREIIGAVTQHLNEGGGSLSLAHPIEIELSETILRNVPVIKLLRFGRNGSDAVNAAIRLCRTYTNRPVIACCQTYGLPHHKFYHGWSDWAFAQEGLSSGVLQCLHESIDWFQYNNIDSLVSLFDKHPNNIAAVIMEGLKFISPEDGFLSTVANLCKKHQSLLVYDEIIHGMRLSIGGAHSYYEIYPDIVCLGKAFATGYPLSIVGGRKEVMKCLPKTGFSLTYGGETTSLIAAQATIRKVQAEDVIAQINKKGNILKKGIEELVRSKKMEETLRVLGYGARFILEFYDGNNKPSSRLRHKFIREAMKHGILTSDIHNISLSHGVDDIYKTIEVYDKIIDTLFNTN